MSNFNNGFSWYDFQLMSPVLLDKAIKYWDLSLRQQEMDDQRDATTYINSACNAVGSALDDMVAKATVLNDSLATSSQSVHRDVASALASLVPPPDNTVITFNDGLSCFAVDDHCYVLHTFVEGEWRRSPYLFDEAIAILKDRLPDDPDYAVQFFNERSSGTL